MYAVTAWHFDHMGVDPRTCPLSRYLHIDKTKHIGHTVRTPFPPRLKVTQSKKATTSQNTSAVQMKAEA